MAESPLWPKEKVDVIEVDEGAPLSLQCNPPPGLPEPVIFWMSSCELGEPFLMRILGMVAPWPVGFQITMGEVVADSLGLVLSPWG